MSKIENLKGRLKLILKNVSVEPCMFLLSLCMVMFFLVLIGNILNVPKSTLYQDNNEVISVSKRTIYKKHSANDIFQE